MPFMDYSLVQELRQQLAGTQAEITSLGSADYTESIRSWSDACKSDAVSTFFSSFVVFVASRLPTCPPTYLDPNLLGLPS
jgi:hypothetical protein